MWCDLKISVYTLCIFCTFYLSFCYAYLVWWLVLFLINNSWLHAQTEGCSQQNSKVHVNSGVKASSPAWNHELNTLSNLSCPTLKNINKFVYLFISQRRLIKPMIISGKSYFAYINLIKRIQVIQKLFIHIKYIYKTVFITL